MERNAEEQLTALLRERLQSEETALTREDWKGHPHRGPGACAASREAQALVPRLFKRAAARRDLIEHVVYLAAEGGEELAERFLSRAEASCAVLLDQPQIGSLLVVRDPELAGIRKWPVKDFESCLVFYLPHDRSVTIGGACATDISTARAAPAAFAGHK